MLETKLTRRSFLGVAGSTAATLALAGCGGGGNNNTTTTESSTATETEPAATEGKVGGGTITAGTAYSTQNYDPSSTSSALALGANWHVVEGLYEIDYHDYSTYTGLAAADPVQVDDTTFEVTLRSGAAFSTGKAVTPEDVVESFARATAEGNIYVSMLTPIASIEKKDDKTVTIKTTIPNFSLLKERLAIVRIIPASMTAEELTTKPIGSGPWMYDEITDASVSFLPNPEYNGDLVPLDDAMRFDVLKDPTARVTAQQEGTTLASESVPADSISQLEAAGCSIDTVQGFGTRFIMFDVAKAPWDDVRVRQAVMYALNYDQMITNALAGMATAPTCYLPDTFANYHKASTVYTYDPEKAAQLIAEAGITPGNITLNTTDNDQVVAMATQVKNDLDALGFNVTIQTDTSAATYASIDQGGNSYDLLLAPGDPSCFGADPDLLMNWWYGDNIWMQTRCPWKESSEWQELHKLMDEALAQEGSAQQETWNKCFDILADNVPLYPVLQVQTTTASWRSNPNSQGVKLEGFEGIGTTGMSFLTAHTVTE